MPQLQSLCPSVSGVALVVPPVTVFPVFIGQARAFSGPNPSMSSHRLLPGLPSSWTCRIPLIPLCALLLLIIKMPYLDRQSSWHCGTSKGSLFGFAFLFFTQVWPVHTGSWSWNLQTKGSGPPLVSLLEADRCLLSPAIAEAADGRGFSF